MLFSKWISAKSGCPCRVTKISIENRIGKQSSSSTPVFCLIALRKCKDLLFLSPSYGLNSRVVRFMVWGSGQYRKRTVLNSKTIEETTGNHTTIFPQKFIVITDNIENQTKCGIYTLV